MFMSVESLLPKSLLTFGFFEIKSVNVYCVLVQLSMRILEYEMEIIGNRLRSFGLRDLVVLLTCFAAAYLLRVRDKIRLQPAWRMESDVAHLTNKKYALNWEKLPNPKITDIESDGINEIVIATRASYPRLKILKLPDLSNSSSKILPFIREQSSVALSSKEDKHHEFKQPVTMETGYLEPYKSMVQVRKQVVVVLLADTTVLCFDNQLRLRWQIQLNTFLDYSKYYVKEAAILISSHELKPDDGGLVVIGYSLGDKNHAEHSLRHSADQLKKPVDDSLNEKSHDERMQEHVMENLDHFTLFGLAGKDGKERLHHRPGDFEVLPKETDIFKAHHFKLGVQRGVTHLNEQHWSQFSESIMQILPHRWKYGRDSSIQLARFMKGVDSVEEAKETESTLPSIFGIDELHLAGYAFGGMRPHNPSEHVKNPNVIVTHSNEGIGVINLVKRWPVTHLKLSHEGGVYVDFNQDGDIDEVKAHFTKDPSSKDNCLAVVKSVHKHSILFNASICSASTFIDMLTASGSFFSSNNFKEGRHSVLPLVVKSVARRTGLLAHLRSLGQEHGYDAVFLLSNGRMTSYGPHGHFNWQINAPIQWNNIIKTSGDLDIYKNAFQASMMSMNLQVYGKQDVAVVAGWNSIAIISLEDGAILCHHSLPCQPTSSLVIGDFDNDGWNDIIVQCPEGYIGFVLKKQTGLWYTAAISILLLVGVAGLTVLCSFDEFYDEEKQSED